jgi:hypothetical protein
MRDALYKDGDRFNDYETWLISTGSKIQTRQTYADYLLVKLRTQEANDQTVEMGTKWLAMYALDAVMAEADTLEY